MTRPRELAGELAALIAGAGGESVLYPAIEIRDLDDEGPVRALLRRAREFDLAVFVSPSAVHKAFVLHAGPWPGRIAAVGEGTRRALQERGVHEAIAPEARADSETLLALPALREVDGARILIVRGVGGRELLARELAARGARVEIAECYRRAPPPAPPPASALDAACVNSAEALDNLVAAFGRERLRSLPVLVPHARVEQHARALGLEALVLAGPGDAQMLARLVAYFGGAK